MVVSVTGAHESCCDIEAALEVTRSGRAEGRDGTDVKVDDPLKL